jgi:hypothetical protein
VIAYLRNNEMASTQDYLARGRQLRDDDISLLKTRWEQLVRNQYMNSDWSEHQLSQDIEAEIGLRGDEPPFERIMDALAHFEGLLIERMRSQDLEAAGEAELAELRAFMDQLAKPKN